jgi:hypothetical protein
MRNFVRYSIFGGVWKTPFSDRHHYSGSIQISLPQGLAGRVVAVADGPPLTVSTMSNMRRRSSSRCSAARRQPGRWNTRAQQPAMPVTNYLASSREAGDKANL